METASRQGANCTLEVKISDLSTYIFSIMASRYLDCSCLLARTCLIGGNLKRTPKSAASARWLHSTWLSKIRCWSLPRSIAITTVRYALFTGVITRFSRGLSMTAFSGQARTHSPQPRQSSYESLASRRLGLCGSFADTSDIASTGQTFTHFPHPLHSWFCTSGIKLVVCTGYNCAKRFEASIASQQQPQQLQIKLTRFLTFSPN